MRKIREVLRLKHERGLFHRAIAQACAIGVGTVTLYLKRTAQQGLGWPLPAELDDAALDAQLFPRPVLVRDRVRPDCAYIHRELKRDGVTLQLLWEEHLQVHPSGYRYTQFCEFYRQWVKRLRPSMRQVHRAGEKTFIDFSGKRPSLVDRRTGELRHLELFVSVLGASSLTYAEATETQQLPDWVNAHIRMAEYFGGATTMWVPDQPKSAITRPCRYEPGVNRAPTKTWPPTTVRSSCRRGRGNLALPGAPLGWTHLKAHSSPIVDRQSGGGSKRLGSPGAEATSLHNLPTRFPEDPALKSNSVRALVAYSLRGTRRCA